MKKLKKIKGDSTPKRRRKSNGKRTSRKKTRGKPIPKPFNNYSIPCLSKEHRVFATNGKLVNSDYKHQHKTNILALESIISNDKYLIALFSASKLTSIQFHTNEFVLKFSNCLVSVKFKANGIRRYIISLPTPTANAETTLYIPHVDKAMECTLTRYLDEDS
jgi:hypothetical protein